MLWFSFYTQGYFQTFPKFQRLPDSTFGDIPVPPAHVVSLNRAAGVMFTSTYESVVWSYRRLVCSAVFGMENTTRNIDGSSYTLCPIPNTESYQKLEMYLGKLRRIDHIKPDGNCLFRSLAKELLGHEKFHHLIRDILIKFIKENESIFSAYVFDDSLESHCKRIQNLGEWGTQTEIFAAATLLHTEIYVFTWQEANQRYQWHCYKPITSHQCSIGTCPTSVQKLWKLQPPANYHVELIHSFQTHFDRVSPSDLTCTSMENAPCLSTDAHFIQL